MLLHPAMQNILFSIHGHIMTTSVIVNRDRMMLKPVNQQMELAEKTANELYQHNRPLLICNPSLSNSTKLVESGVFDQNSPLLAQTYR